MSKLNQEKSTRRPGVGVGVLVFNTRGQLLLGKRKSPNGRGTWSVPGGHLEWMETWEECAAREVREETGLQITNPRVIGGRNYIDQEQGQHFLDTYMMVDPVAEGEVPRLMELEKCEGWQWFEMDKLPRPLFREYGEIWRNYQEKMETVARGEKAGKQWSLVPGVDYVGVTTAMFCHDGRGNFLLNKRSQKCRDEHGRWDAWGGRVEFGEKLEEAARRELGEECGAMIKKIEQKGLSTALRTDPAGRRTHWVVVVFLVEIERGTERNLEPDKFEEIAWFEGGKWPVGVHSMLAADYNIAIGRS